MRNDAEKKKIVQRETLSQVATSPGAQRLKKMPIVQNPAHVTRISQKGTSQIRPADTCPAKGEAPARPGKKTERPQTGHRRATGPAAGAGKAAGAEGDYTVAGRGSAASNKAARPCWVMMVLLCTALESNPKKRGKPWLHRSLISKFPLKIAEFFSVFFPKISQIIICPNLAKFC